MHTYICSWFFHFCFLCCIFVFYFFKSWAEWNIYLFHTTYILSPTLQTMALYICVYLDKLILLISVVYFASNYIISLFNLFCKNIIITWNRLMLFKYCIFCFTKINLIKRTWISKKNIYCMRDRYKQLWLKIYKIREKNL